MTSVRNHRPPLSGSKWLFFVCLALILAACSPKVRPVTTANKPEAPVAKNEPEKAPAKPAEAKAASIALLLPFGLDNLNPGSGYTSGTLSNANLSLDYYQGFKLALDSLTSQGYNYKLQVFDTKEQTLEAQNLAYNATIRTSNLIVGPVFPEDLQAFTNTLSGMGKSILTVSPLSPASPTRVKDENMVTVATPLEYHAWSAAGYIVDHYKPKNVFILKSGFSEDNNYITPFRKGIDSLSKHKTKIIAPTIVRGQLNGLIPQLSLTEENII